MLHSSQLSEACSLVNSSGSLRFLVNLLQRDEIGLCRPDDPGNTGEIEFSVQTSSVVDVVAEYPKLSGLWTG